MPLDDFIIACFCRIDDDLTMILTDKRLRSRGPHPRLRDSEVLTMELVGEFLGLSTDTALFAYFQRHWVAYFPGLVGMHRTTFVRQATALRHLKEQLWQRWVACLTRQPSVGIIDSFPLPVCQFARAPRCRRFAGEAAFGKDPIVKQTFYGFRVHVRLALPGIITRFAVVAANIHERHLVAPLTAQTNGLLIGDRNYWLPEVAQELGQGGIILAAPYRSAKRDPFPRWSAALSRIRYRIDTVFGQLVERMHIKRVWARDWPHLANRLLRKICLHTLAVWLCLCKGLAPLRFAQLVA